MASGSAFRVWQPPLSQWRQVGQGKSVSCFRWQRVRFFSAPVEGAIPPSKQKYVSTSGTYPLGFSASGVHVGVKASNTRHPDLALIASATPCTAAAVFTKNRFQAAPVTVSRETLNARAGSGLRAVVINSGCANAVTGRGGLEDATAMAHAVDACLDPASAPPDPSSTLVMSTGVIGQRLPIAKILARVPAAYDALAPEHDGWMAAARAICTTDTFPKLLSTTFTLPSTAEHGLTYRLAGMTKGAGMIHPNMATLLSILATDVPVPAPALKTMLTRAMDDSFNAISIDGDTSTNDTVALLANGAAHAANRHIPAPALESLDSADAQAFQAALTAFAQQLAQLVVRDGEGATKFVRVRVVAASSTADARRVAASVAKSPLVKTALYGRDANWGRILCAVGYTDGLRDPGAVVPERTSVSFVPVGGGARLKLLVEGEPEAVDEARASEILKDEDLEILVELGTGTEEASYWFCDFSHGKHALVLRLQAWAPADVVRILHYQLGLSNVNRAPSVLVAQRRPTKTPARDRTRLTDLP